MNLIEGKVEWCGNGVVVIKERSALQTVWRLCVHVERQLHSMFQRIAGSSKNLLSKGARLLENTGENSVSDIQLDIQLDNQPGDQPASSKKSSSQPKLRSIKRQSMKIRPNKARPNKVKPKGTLTEIRRYAGEEHANAVSGDEQNGLQQLLPALAGFCHDRWLVLVSPPQRPDAAALTAAGIDPSRVLLVHARDIHAFNNADRNSGLNAVEQALQSGNCGAVVAWLEECDTSTLQRLRRAAVQGHAWGVMFREAEKETAQLEMVMR